MPDDLLHFSNLYRSLDDKRHLRETAAVKSGQILAVQGPSGS